MKQLSPTLCWPNGTPLPSMIPSSSLFESSSCNYLSIMSFNLLAPVYVRPIDKRTGEVQPFAAFEWVQDSSLLEWENRKTRLLGCLQSCQADVICLQELQLERSSDESLMLPNWLSPLCHHESAYDVILPPEEELENIAERNRRVLGLDVAVVCAIMVQRNTWKAFEYSNILNQRKDVKNTNTCISVCLHNQKNQEIDPLVVSSLHLDATDEKKRVGQLSRCLRQGRFLLDEARRREKKYSKISLPSLTTIIAGDMNTEFLPGSCVACFLNGQSMDETDTSNIEQQCAAALRLDAGSMPSEVQLEEWKKCQDEMRRVVQDYCVSVRRVNTGPTRSAYDPTVGDTNIKEMAQWSLDHLLYTQDRLKPISMWAALEEDSESCKTGLPNRICPSDHLPIAALFEILPSVHLQEEDKKNLLNRFNTLIETQKHSIEELTERMEKELASVKEKFDMIKTNSEDSTNKAEKGKKKKKQKKGPPPKEIQDCMRKKRGLLKDLRAAHMLQRKDFVDNLNDFERLVIQEGIGMSCKVWVEQN